MSQGFKFAPITFGISVFSSIGTFFLSRRHSSHLRLGIDTVSLANGNYARILSNGIYFPSYPQVISSVILLYSFRQFERQMGSNKFGSFVLTSYVLATLTQMGIVVSASSMGVPLTLSAGPYFLIYSLLACYHKLVPKIQPSKANISSIVFSEKSWVYFLAMQLLFSEGTSSFLAGVSGLLTGYLYLNDVMSLQQFRLPSFISRLFSPLTFLCGPTAASALPNGPTPVPPGRPGQGRGNNGGRGPPMQGQGAFGGAGGGYNRGENLLGGHGGMGYQRHHMPPPPPPPEESIESLINLGFERDRVIRALQSRDNNVEAAANFLLSGND
mmetsp:Transcript_12415/g.22985  ORF Transcript_12415/g.22985 Transcript_12415/m.22985 type:complete len:327 (-) Transcript_12415:86-1066(-)